MVHICIIILKCLSLIAQGKKKISYRLIIVTGNSNPAHFEPDATALKKLRTRQLVFHSECASHTLTEKVICRDIQNRLENHKVNDTTKSSWFRHNHTLPCL